MKNILKFIASITAITNHKKDLHKIPFRRTACFGVFIALCTKAYAQTGEGPGFPNIDYPASQEGSVLSLNNPGKAISATLMHRGYLFVPLGADNGGGRGAGDFAFYDISDPTAVENIFDSRDHDSVYGNSDSLNYVGDFAEIHHLNVSGDYMMLPERRGNGSGFSILDVSNLYDNDPQTIPQIVGRYNYPGITNPDNYDGWTFAAGWQGQKYYWGPTGTNGLFVVDTSDLSDPQLVTNIPMSQLENDTMHVAVPIGNLLILTTSRAARTEFRALVMDISDPENPQLINSFTGPLGYQTFTYGPKLYGGSTGANGSPLTAHDFSDPQNIVTTVLNPDAGSQLDRPEYGFGKDDDLFIGHYPGMTKWEVSGGSATKVLEVNSGIVDDHAFIAPLGNLITVVSDHNNDRRMIFGIQNHERDVLPPLVNFTSPSNGETNVNVRSRVGLCFTDFIDSTTVDGSTFIVRNVQTGEEVPGTYSTMNGIVNFAPNNELAADQTYEVVLAPNGISDQVGNSVPIETFVMSFSTGNEVTGLSTTVNVDEPQVKGQVVNLSVSVSNQGGNLEHAWDFGDGTPQTAFSPSNSISHTYSEPGNHLVRVFSRAVGSTNFILATSVQVVHNPISALPPISSTTIVYDEDNNLVWNVNPDNNSVTAIDSNTYLKRYEIPSGANPRTLALGPNNLLWVTNKNDASLTTINRATGNVAANYSLPYGSAPHGIVVHPDAGVAYVSLEGTKQVAEVSLSSGGIINTLDVGAWPRSLSLDPTRNRLWVGRFISPDDAGKVIQINTNNFTLVGESSLSIVHEPDSLSNGRGLPNYLGAMSISPDGTQLFIPSKKDNILRGALRDGLDLTFETTVRSMASRIDLVSGQEDISQRIDFDNNDFATAVAYSPLGNRMFFTTSGSSAIWGVDAYNTENSFTFGSGGRAPDGLVLSANGEQLFVHNSMSRSVTVFDTSLSCSAVCGTSPQVANVSTVANESLSPEVLRGKQLFYDTQDPRLAQEGYMSCASCHLDGGHDGRTWDFTGMGEGLRNTIDLNGRGEGHGPVHWTANFDEIHDFEGQLRGLSSGTGLMNDADFNFGTRSEPLGLSKTDLSDDLDALTAYVVSLTTVGNSPHRNDDGNLTADAVAGRAIFTEKNCASCHNGESFTDSISLIRHDVGTLTSNSGGRLGGAIDGLDTPTLRGLWNGAPYLHDGSATTLREVLTTKNASGHHGDLSDLSNQEVDQLVAYLQQIDDNELSAPATFSNGAPSLAEISAQTNNQNTAIFLNLIATDPDGDALIWSSTGLPPGVNLDPNSGVLSGVATVRGLYTVNIGVRDSFGNSDSQSFQWAIVHAIETISVNFVGGSSASTGTVINTLSSTDLAGAVPVGYWNNAGIANFTPAGGTGTNRSGSINSLVNSVGTSTTASLTWNSNNAWSNPIPENTPDDYLIRGYLDTTNTSTTTVELSNLEVGTGGYDLYLYVEGGTSANRVGRYDVYEGSGTQGTLLGRIYRNEDRDHWDGDFDEATGASASSATEGNYLIFSGLSASSITVTATPEGNSGTRRAPLNGLQVLPSSVSPGPSSPFDDWVIANGLTDANFTSDSDRDGIPDLLEFVLNGNPNVNDHAAILPYIVSDQESSTFEFTRRIDSTEVTTQTIQYSYDLTNWTNILANEMSPLVSINNNKDGISQLVSLDLTPLELEDRRIFVRLKVEEL